MKHVNKLLFAATCAVLAGCVSVNDPIQVGPDEYMVSLSAMGGMSSASTLLVTSIGKAREFCAAKGLDLYVIDTHSGGAQGWTPMDNQVRFKCVPYSVQPDLSKPAPG